MCRQSGLPLESGRWGISAMQDAKLVKCKNTMQTGGIHGIHGSSTPSVGIITLALSGVTLNLSSHVPLSRLSHRPNPQLTPSQALMTVVLLT